MTIEERNTIQAQILELATAKASRGHEYSYAFGYVFAMLTDEQIATLDEYSSKSLETLATAK
jgi:hypothetical protein